MKTSRKIILITAFLSIFGLSGLARAVQATQTQHQVAVMSQPQRHPQITEVTQASGGDVETNNSAKEQSKTANLHSLAKITPQQAQKAAETVQGGRASRVKLENENGNLVYAVTIGQQELLVDAGNGRVLSSSNPNTEQNEGLQTRSSVQMAHPSHGDSETNDGKEK